MTLEYTLIYISFLVGHYHFVNWRRFSSRSLIERLKINVPSSLQLYRIVTKKKNRNFKTHHTRLNRQILCIVKFFRQSDSISSPKRIITVLRSYFCFCVVFSMIFRRLFFQIQLIHTYGAHRYLSKYGNTRFSTCLLPRVSRFSTFFIKNHIVRADNPWTCRIELVPLLRSIVSIPDEMRVCVRNVSWKIQIVWVRERMCSVLSPLCPFLWLYNFFYAPFP